MGGSPILAAAQRTLAPGFMVGGSTDGSDRVIAHAVPLDVYAQGNRRVPDAERPVVAHGDGVRTLDLEATRKA